MHEICGDGKATTGPKERQLFVIPIRRGDRARRQTPLGPDYALAKCIENMTFMTVCFLNSSIPGLQA